MILNSAIHESTLGAVPYTINPHSKIAHLRVQVATAAHRLGFVWQARRAVLRLRRTRSAPAHTMADALEGALRHDTEAAIPAIEALRTTLLRDTTSVTFRDYGAQGRLAHTPDAGAREVTRTVGTICQSSIPPHEGRVLYHLIRRFKPVRCLELGTCLGLSAAYQAAALKRNGAGHLVTLEGGVALARLAEHHLQALHLPSAEVVTGPFAETLPAVLQTHSPIDFAFIDGHHNPVAMLTYYRQLAPHLADGAVLVFDDIFWTTGMRRAWLALTAAPHLQHSVDLLAFGLCIYTPPA